ncbi:aminoglycoside N(3)-acetyltransferase [Achromobacter sp. UMC71]|uniref:aminoglycoside N(3)-acetyltransferase n=1 Tax=Achromobacter sp. UMC71 TaxID=1862320 RepID=UPI0015FFD479|nr:AAC(3) family N-acetyltransferase [Achromobacter sp. UMC71]MBB1628073.1 AAC(3) family N-acetyltransferase [Achromobacter sp. UMC71]
MTEADLLARTPSPATRASLAVQLHAAGLQPGAALLVHTSLSALGWIAGGPVAVIQALLDVVGPDGLVAMPAHSSDLTDPALWQAPPVPTGWLDTLRREMPAYDAAITPTRRMGTVAELFRTWPGVRRSQHPTCSFAAIGPRAAGITAGHQLEDPFGDASPLAKLLAADADILLLGVGFDACTMLHLAELRAWPDRPRQPEASPIIEDGQRVWKRFTQPALLDPEHFLPVGQSLIDRGLAVRFEVGAGHGWRVSARTAVDHALDLWRGTPPPG